MRHYFRHTVFLLLAWLALSCSANTSQTLEGIVTRIADGDTLYVQDATHNRHKVRLLGIDAPEHGQAFGELSRQSLAGLTYLRPVSVDWRARDIYGRILGRVRVAAPDCRQPDCPQAFDANLEQVRLGFAWWNKKYAHTQFPGDAAAYEAAEQRARAAKAGLWVDPNPTPPWRWRYANRIGQDKVAP